LDNYEKRLIRLAEKSASSLTKLQKFHTISKEKYLPQVQQDYEAFSPKLRRLENLINYIRASVAIEEEKRDRKFQNMVAIWGIGLATGAIVASLSGLFPDNITSCCLYNFFDIKWWETMVAAEISVASAIVAGLLTQITIWFFR
ncbi:MAG: hypothetical protein KAG43_05590, partial [Candidatus Marithrix sp.]|nr:hypothetical protein [Candidatus Marithrix sp.]